MYTGSLKLKMRTFLIFVAFLVSRLSRASDFNIVFPPLSVEEENSLPRGHLKPFGYQNDPEGPVKEYDHFLSAPEFWEKHGRDRIPLVYRQVVKDSPAIKLWTDEYLREKYGDLDVLVEHKKENRSSSSGRMRLHDFLDGYKNDDMYIVSMLPQEMMPEIQAVNTVLCGTWKNFTHESNLWMSNGGTRSVIHYDADHNFHCLLAGRKDFIMIRNSRENRKILGIHRYNPNAGSGYSLVNPDAVNVTDIPNIDKVGWTYATLYAGDCIYIPRAYLHQVRSYNRTLAATTLFTEDTSMSFDGNGCTEELLKEYHSMADIYFHWTYKKGDEMIDMGFQNVELFRRSLLDNIKQFGENNRFYWKHFKQMVLNEEHGREIFDSNKVKNCFENILNGKDKGYIDIEAAKTFTVDQLKAFIRLVEAPHGVVTNGTEKVFVRPGDNAKDDDSEDDVNRTVLDIYLDNMFESALKDGDNKITFERFRKHIFSQGTARTPELAQKMRVVFDDVLNGKKMGYLDKPTIDSFTRQQREEVMELLEEAREFQGQGSDDEHGLRSGKDEGGDDQGEDENQDGNEKDDGDEEDEDGGENENEGMEPEQDGEGEDGDQERGAENDGDDDEQNDEDGEGAVDGEDELQDGEGEDFEQPGEEGAQDNEDEEDMEDSDGNKEKAGDTEEKGPEKPVPTVHEEL